MLTWDGDEIMVTESDGKSGVVTITLTVDEGITWWKGILEISNNEEIIGLKDGHRGPVSYQFSIYDLDKYRLGKAKTWGVYVPMYSLHVKGGFKSGKTYTYRWISDTK